MDKQTDHLMQGSAKTGSEVGRIIRKARDGDLEEKVN